MTILAFGPVPFTRLLIQLIRTGSLIRIAAISIPRETPLDSSASAFSVSFFLCFLSTFHIPFTLETQFDNIRSHNVFLAFSKCTAVGSSISSIFHIFSILANVFRAPVVSGVGEGMRTMRGVFIGGRGVYGFPFGRDNS